MILSFRQCHLIVFWFLMTYLLFFRTVNWFGLPTPPGHTNMIQMIMTLKIIGVAFERNAVLLKLSDADKSDDKQVVLTPAEKALKEISIADMFHYCFNYIGLLTGELSWRNFRFISNFSTSRSILHVQNLLRLLPLSVRNQCRLLDGHAQQAQMGSGVHRTLPSRFHYLAIGLRNVR